MNHNPLISIVTPAYNEESNIELFYQQLIDALQNKDFTWEWIIVDDHSIDDTALKIKEISSSDERVKFVRLSKNSGTHISSICGLQKSSGNCCVIMACDLQDPPLVIPKLVSKWVEGNQVVWAVRENQASVGYFSKISSRMYHFVINKLLKTPNTFANGADFLLVDKKVANGLLEFNERHISILTVIAKIGFKQTSILYYKKHRINGVSNWTLSKKVKLFIDSILSFSYKPIRTMSLTGVLVATLGFIYALLIIYSKITLDQSVDGWASLIVVCLILGGIQMIMLGVLGEYLWRSLDESRKRPLFFIEDELGFDEKKFKNDR